MLGKMADHWTVYHLGPFWLSWSERQIRCSVIYLVRTLLPTFLLSGIPLLLASCATNSILEQSKTAERRGQWERAYQVLHEEYQRQLADGEVSEELAREHERLRREYLRDRAQALIFRERQDEALALLDQLEASAPDIRGLDELRQHAKFKQAKALTAAGDRLLSQREFQSAMAKYLESQRIIADFGLAVEGMERVKDELARMDAVAQRQFLQAVRKYPEFRHIEVSWHAESVLRNTPDLEDERRGNAQRLRDQALAESARAIFAEAKACEEADKFGAALVLYRQAGELDPDIGGVNEAIDKMNAELAALGLIESAQMTMLSGDFARASLMLQEAFDKSELSRGAISELMIQNRRLEGDGEYRAARDFEVMGKKAEALAAFEALAAKWPDGFEDEAARIDALRVDIAGAEAEWQAALDAEAAGDLEKALDHFANSARFYQAWRDAAAQIERLKKVIAEKAGATGGEGAR